MAAQDPGLSDEDRLARRNSFTAEAERYDRVRPGYPDALFDRVAAFGALESGAGVLEIAAGTGKATDSLVERGWRVDAIELGEEMAAVLEARLGDRVRVVVGAFEDVPIEQGAFDLVFCATAFHWLDPGTRVERVAGALRPGGTAAVVWTRHVQGGTQAFFDASGAVYARAGMGSESPGLPTEASVLPHDAEFRADAAFSAVETASFIGDVEYDTASYLDLVCTYSETIAAPAARRRALLDGLREVLDRDFGGRIVKRHLFSLVLARRG